MGSDATRDALVSPKRNLAAAGFKRLQSFPAEGRGEDVAAAMTTFAPAAPVVGQVGFLSPRFKDLKPASTSLFESTLHHPNAWRLPGVAQKECVKQSLQTDRIKSFSKYANGSLPAADAARFNISLPKGPQNKKYCSRKTMSSLMVPSQRGSRTESTAADSKLTKFSIQTLEEMFLKLAENEVISHRKFMVSLNQQQDLLDTFHKYSQAIAVSEDVSEKRRAQLPKGTKYEELARMKLILLELDADGSGLMEWDEFVEFFRRAGLLLEYKSCTALNRSVLDDRLETGRQQEQEQQQKEEEKMMKERDSLEGDDLLDKEGGKKLLRYATTLELEVKEVLLDGVDRDLIPEC